MEVLGHNCNQILKRACREISAVCEPRLEIHDELSVSFGFDELIGIVMRFHDDRGCQVHSHS